MSLKRSQNYLYFQNKAIHYHNIQSAKSRIEHHLPNHLRHTIDHSQHIQNRDVPYNKNYQINFQNKNLANRILSISNSNRHSVMADGSYARFNKFQRSFRQNNPFKNQEERQIKLQNEKIRSSVSNVKPRIGSHQNWQAEYKHKNNYRKLLSRYEQNQKQKGQLLIQKELFLPESYLKYIEQLQNQGSNKKIQTVEGSRTSRGRPKLTRIDKESLFILPIFTPNTLTPLDNDKDINEDQQFHNLTAKI